jgi:hypothetical protein
VKLTYTNPTSRIVIEAEVPDVKTVFETVTEVQELFDEKVCGACSSTDIRCDVRTAQGFRFYNLKCRVCSARLDFGQQQNSKTLFAKRRNDDGTIKPHNGWYVYQPETGILATATQTQPDLDLSSIAEAKDKSTLRKIGDRIKADLAGKEIDAKRAAVLREAYERRQGELMKGRAV